MAVISAFSVSHPLAGIRNPYTSVGMRRFDTRWWPAGTSAGSEPGASYLNTAWPVEANGIAINGMMLGGYSRDFYHRIHIAPSVLDLGNIISTQTQAVNIWNAHLTPRQLTSIDGLQEGLALTGQPAPPLLFTALQEREWTVAITPDGPAVLDALLQWVFDSGDTADLAITGNRITAFPWSPNWAAGVQERLSWLTDIMQSPTGAEQRRGLRLSPRRGFTAEVHAVGRERQAFDMALLGWSTRVWAIPVWTDGQAIPTAVTAGDTFIPSATAYLDFRANGLAILRGMDAFSYETVEIAEVLSGGVTLKRPLQTSWAAGTLFYPGRTARLTQTPERARKTDTVQTAKVDFEVVEACDWPAMLPSTVYRGYPVYLERPDESQDLTSSFANLTLRLDNQTGIPRLLDTSGKAMSLFMHRWQIHNRVAGAALRSFLYGLDGRRVPVWIPTHADDLTVVETVAANSTAISIAAIGYARYAQNKPGRRDIHIRLKNGAEFYRRILGAAEISPGIEQLVIDGNLGQTVTPSEIRRISFMQLVRGDSDNIELRHDTSTVTSTQQIFRGVRDDDL